MGYACPVCEIPQIDANHLANHMAFTALLGDDEHEAWLDDMVPDWETLGPAELGDRICSDVESAEFQQVFENTVSDSHPTNDPIEERSGMLFDAESTGPFEEKSNPNSPPPKASNTEADAETARILEEARELTKQMRTDSEEDA